ncbi:MAG: glutamate synthase subunit alpha, partial [Rothia sp. (in: high G+C Gram-positive bacteria)]|nr:glutamate synthase subunit alpha [Rothia sp. (in: high G+C Gram-positive bacteria)]
HWKASGLDLSKVLTSTAVDYQGQGIRHLKDQDHELDQHIDNSFIAAAQETLSARTPVSISAQVVNTDRSIGTMLGHTVTKTFGIEVLDHDSITLNLTGQAGQSLGAFLPQGITIRLTGDSNDYVGKGLSGGRIILAPDPAAPLVAEENVVAGNVIGYGATSGEMFIRGIVGERFLVRNSGATAVVEGIGDHGCEYMTGGRALILGATGRNFAAGMSGGYAYLLDLDMAKVNKQSRESGELTFLELNEEDRAEVAQLLTRHRTETGSALASALLEDLEGTFARITKVLPRDFAAVQAIRAEAAAAGEDTESMQVWTKILEVTARG